ncbi:FAD-dependent monooxygenase [Neosynechococcus sphagnicola]|uniref:FAD-dependent monooxygenase n=1 Tax=Neosynechococcus sphagnicola TaxID=1501145 RepID=UPI003B82F22E
MAANVRELVASNGTIQGVRYWQQGVCYEVRASLTIGADGRGSKVRQLAGIKLLATAPSIDVLSFRLPLGAEDCQEVNLTVHIGQGYYFALIDRFDGWQVYYTIPKGSYPQLRAAGLDTLRRAIAERLPQFQERVQSLQDWSQTSLLSVQSGRVDRWYRPGLLLIGDAAHPSSPVGGVGITAAIQDAIATANHVSQPLGTHRLQTHHLAAVQRQRSWAIWVLQTLQTMSQKQFVAKALDPNRPFRLPLSFRLPWVRSLIVRVAAFGIWPVRLQRSRRR